ncbi:MAG: LPXTG cell wall anchor domain-containing protein, partial [Lachnospiraceae bacterium]|nr:LPXTG cell wall anchor domain-containing protein [Lachnospiraceae bacterium]
TTRRKQSENTPCDRSTVGPPPSAPGESPEVASAYRDPESEVLGVARTPQADLGASRLPQTGQLWWPVPIFMIAGIALMAGGLVKRRSDE